MDRSSRLWRSLAVGGSLALVLTACGGDDDDEPAATSEATMEAEATEAAGNGSTGDGTLQLGTLLPQTGQLAFLGPPMITGSALAVAEVNEAGGVLGTEVVQIDADEGDTESNIASQSADRLLNEGIDAMVGAAASGITQTVLDKVTGAGVVMVSPSNTGIDITDLSTNEDRGLYFRTAPSDVLQGRTVGDLILEDGYGSVAIIARQDTYGEGLANKIAETVTDGGGEVVFGPEFYDPKSTGFEAILEQVSGSGADAVAIVSFDEITSIIPQAVSRNVGPQDLPWYLVDGNTKNFGDQIDAGVMTATKGTIPGQEVSQEFIDRLAEQNGEPLEDLTYAAEAFDAAMLIMLAAEAAGDDSSAAIAEALPSVSADGTECSTFAECKDLLDAGEDIDYVGQSGPIDWNEIGDPTSATIGIYEFGDDNNYTKIDEVSGQL